MFFIIAFAIIWAFFGFNHAFEAAFALGLLAVIFGLGAAPGIIMDKTIKDIQKNRKNNS
ncbi:hypothetical protein [Acidiferrobacter sp. SPIII_3]|uniref:hypothetical protein n=1 Tax=Acidiferrobacter sp. SPIII_3 TaxID=1281578 RepID=UPI00143D5429|nr:hypothetical protein [Acidiferrobacter sp. SPIII_3]